MDLRDDRQSGHAGVSVVATYSIKVDDNKDTPDGTAYVERVTVNGSAHLSRVMLHNTDERTLISVALDHIAGFNTITTCTSDFKANTFLVDDDQLVMMWRELGKHLVSRGKIDKA